jgi:polysaccharide export outer membrane protein
MKPGSLLIAAILSLAFFCHAQDKVLGDHPALPETSAPALPNTAKAAAPDSYVIGASDVIVVTVFKEPTLSGSLLVRPDGMISMSLLGDVKASGKSPVQLADEITANLKKYVQDPNVTVVLSQSNSRIVYLMGEVSKPGPVGITPGMTLLQAIATGGGLTPYANAKKIYILRNTGGKQERIPVRFKQALRGDGSLNLTLSPGDTIVVP